MANTDPSELQRFVDAQSPVLDSVLTELKSGRKRSHWMWFVFPQLRGLGQSPMARLYGISSLDEARAYLAHPVLGPRLAECTEAVMAVEGRTLREIFGSPDDLKFCSSMTLFAVAAGRSDPLFETALRKYCDAGMDDRTLALLEEASGQTPLLA